jgi:hypothetical protein
MLGNPLHKDIQPPHLLRKQYQAYKTGNHQVENQQVIRDFVDAQFPESAQGGHKIKQANT